jgi:hypothetical protein
MFELLFCPQHGLFRPDNVVLFLAYAGAARMEFELLAVRVWVVIGRFV